MSPDEKPPRPQIVAVVVATAAVTLAIGVTTAALTGYLAPRGKAAPQPTLVAPTAPAGEAGAAKAIATAKKDPPRSIVLVPVTEEAPHPKRGPAIAHRRRAPILAADHDDDEREHEHVATADDSGEREDEDD